MNPVYPKYHLNLLYLKYPKTPKFLLFLMNPQSHSFRLSP
jgi:hypothetical protein